MAGDNFLAKQIQAFEELGVDVLVIQGLLDTVEVLDLFEFPCLDLELRANFPNRRGESLGKRRVGMSDHLLLHFLHRRRVSKESCQANNGNETFVAGTEELGAGYLGSSRGLFSDFNFGGALERRKTERQKIVYGGGCASSLEVRRRPLLELTEPIWLHVGGLHHALLVSSASFWQKLGKLLQ